MLSIGQMAKAAKVSARAVRHYEELGLIRTTIRGDNNYRYFDKDQLEVLEKIRGLQQLGFSLEEVRDILALGPASMTTILQKRLDSVGSELSQLHEREERLKSLLSISQRVELSQTIGLQERKMYMDVIKEQVISGVRERQGSVNEAHLGHLNREQSLYDTPEKRAFINGVTKCIKFAKEQHLTLGPGRGSCPASVILYGLGFSGIDPTQYDLIPERLSSLPPDIHIDVEFERGQIFVDFCRDVSKQLAWGKITAFKMPLLDIINNVHQKIGGTIDYRSISDDDGLVLNNIRNADIDKIFLLDYSPGALVMKYQTYLDGYNDTEKLKEFLRSTKIESFREVINLISVWRPDHPEKIARIDRYRHAVRKPHRYGFLTPELQAMLAKNFGVVIFHEDLMQIISVYTGWEMERCNRLRRDLFLGTGNSDIQIFEALAPKQVFDLVLQESPWTYCKAHAMSFAQLTKQTAVLKSLHKDIYFEEIAKWEAQNGFVWDDIGIKIKGVSLLQH